MAGGSPGSKDPKKLQFLKNNSSEVLKDDHADFAPPPPAKLSLKGILGLGQTVEFSRPVEKAKEIVTGINHLSHEANVLFDNRQRELEQSLRELRDKLAQLAAATDNLDKDVQAAALSEVPEASEYQLTFYARLTKFIDSVRESISEAGIWVQAFAAKKKKRNYFWNTANNKKKGGTQFMFSDESGVSRSAG